MPGCWHGDRVSSGCSRLPRSGCSGSCRFIVTANSSISASDSASDPVSDMTPRNFSLACVGLILVLVGAVGAFNRLVDPFWYYRDTEVAGINRDKPRAPGNERLVKLALMNRLKP